MSKLTRKEVDRWAHDTLRELYPVWTVLKDKPALRDKLETASADIIEMADRMKEEL